ncbi:MAG: endopeptidase La [Patescibacteria group bacterium]|nr:endopeptidase La [Patescibacteria group bacterium]
MRPPSTKPQNIKIKSELPLLALRGAVVFPRIAAPLFILDKASLKAVDAAMKGDRLVVCTTVNKEKSGPLTPADFYKVGVVAKIRDMVRQPDGKVRVLIEGIDRAKITGFVKADGYIRVKLAKFSKPKFEKNEKIEAQMYNLVSQFKECVNMGATVPFDVLLIVMNITDPWQLCDIITLNLEFKTAEKQAILEAESIEQKLDRAAISITRLIKVLRMSKKIQTETGKELGKMEREMFLREQLKTIQKELGMLDGKSDEDDMSEKIKKAKMSKGAEKQALKELARLEGMPSFSPEIAYIRTYLEWLSGLPWSIKTASKLNIKQAEKILNEDHYGLLKVKERILEYLAVQKLVGKIKGPILCFAGPPGTGKTSIGKSIARSLGRKFVRMSLGGVRDEAEIRGHRRTYVGALPGRIIQGINTAGTKNPVFMLDEIDKLSHDAMRGDPSSALLEALDPEQNNEFADHYLEVPFDLSDVMFITTANLLDTVPPALRDRMEVIEFPGYTEDEKFHIATGYLFPKQLKNHGLTEKNLGFDESGLREIIRSYTREAGVRNLERQIASVCRKIAKTVAENGVKNTVVKGEDAQKYLGPRKFTSTLKEETDEVGVATGLAWTEAGGEILLIEATRMIGKGKLILTGHLGKVMQESAQAAFSYARTKAGDYKTTMDFGKNDFHIHVPAGAIPKDGPSAGVAMASVLASLLVGKPLRKDVGMTGEITLHGKVMEIGGVKEKVLAAHRAGLKTIILPKNNEKDLVDIPEKIKKSIRFIFASTIDDVLKVALKK